ncbi:MAG: SBBP repeat-containing protein [Candidatus Latescibacteria bacterium]|nr:SBBP repeat-containing protein [Candidatus Latescibacterota bacterium]
MKHLFRFVILYVIFLTIPVRSQEVNNTLLFNNIPLYFSFNNGQLSSEVTFSSHKSDCTILFTSNVTTFLLTKGNEQQSQKDSYVGKKVSAEQGNTNIDMGQLTVLKRTFLNTNEHAVASGEDRLSWNTNYFFGGDPEKWVTDVPNYAAIRITDLYEGIDLVYYGVENTLKYDLVVNPNGDIGNILFTYEGADSCRIDESGDLTVFTALGSTIEKKPYCYQVIDNKTIEREAQYSNYNNEPNTFSFTVNSYDPRYSLVIDPELVFSVFIGGSKGEEAHGIAVDDSGYIYLIGDSQSSDFPTTPGFYDEYLYERDIFICKIDPSNYLPVYSTFIYRGSGNDIAVDENGCAYITGKAIIDYYYYYTWENFQFPTTEGAFDTTPNGQVEIFVSKINPEGNELVYSTFIGGSYDDGNSRLCIDDEGCVYITGETDSFDFPTTAEALDTTHNGVGDVFLCRINPSGSVLIFSTFLGGSKNDYIGGISVDNRNNVYITGYTYSSEFPTTVNELTKGKEILGEKIFISKLNDIGELIYSTFFGGSYGSAVADICVDNNGNAYIVGGTKINDFPTTESAYCSTLNNIFYNDVFATKINTTGTGLVYSTFIGGTEQDNASKIIVDSYGNAYITGLTWSDDFPVTLNAYDNSYDGDDFNGYICKLNQSGSDLLYSTYFGISDYDYIGNITIDKDNNLYITGATRSNNFPATYGTINDNYDVFVCKFSFQENITSIEVVPDEFCLNPPFPNPFNPSTTLTFTLPSSDFASIIIYNIMGQQVRELVSENMTPGTHSVVWDGNDNNNRPVSSGIYFSRLTSDKYQATSKMLLIR